MEQISGTEGSTMGRFFLEGGTEVTTAEEKMEATGMKHSIAVEK